MVEKVVEKTPVGVLRPVRKIEDSVSGFKVLEYLSKGRKIDDLRSAEVELRSLQSEERSPRWTSTIVVNEAPNKKFGNVVEYERLQFRVPWQDYGRRYQGIENIALILDSTTIKIEEKDGKKLLKADILKSQIYPAKSGMSHVDKETGIPIGAYTTDNPEARYLKRSQGARIGPVVIDDGVLCGCGERGIAADERLYHRWPVGFTEQDPQAISGKMLSAELISAARSSMTKLESTTKQELTAPIKELLRALE